MRRGLDRKQKKRRGKRLNFNPKPKQLFVFTLTKVQFSLVRTTNVTSSVLSFVIDFVYRFLKLDSFGVYPGKTK